MPKKPIKTRKRAAMLYRTGLFLANLLLAGSLLAACSLDYAAALPEELGDGIPDTVVYGFSHTVVQNGNIRFVLKAEQAETWEKKGQIVMRGINFTEYGTDSQDIVAQGTADQGIFHTKTESADLKGNVYFAAPGDQISIRSGNLSWDGEKQTLASQLDTITELSSKQSRLSGAGFAADARRRSFIFQETISGRFVPDQGNPE